ncbi:hypothetical protein [Rhodovarius lipocyclicus]|uniref:hypothetical protein n=1 Tax=Rhodovarius lipocyclicus TaxID=268410 RepID=UPI00135A22EC|nr:hypothetical protein [Rhodovarius lipocyclicus]
MSGFLAGLDRDKKEGKGDFRTAPLDIHCFSKEKEVSLAGKPRGSCGVGLKSSLSGRARNRYYFLGMNIDMTEL